MQSANAGLSVCFGTLFETHCAWSFMCWARFGRGLRFQGIFGFFFSGGGGGGGGGWLGFRAV